MSAWDAAARVIQATSVIAFVAEVVAGCVLLDGPARRPSGPSWHFWAHLASVAPALGMICLISGVAAIFKEPVPPHPRRVDVRWCLGLNIVTIAIFAALPAAQVPRPRPKPIQSYSTQAIERSPE